MRDRLTRVLFDWLSRRSLLTIHRLGDALGWALFVLPTDARKTTLDNLQRCFPERSKVERMRLARRSLAESAKAILEMSVLWSWSQQQFQAHIKAVEGMDDMQRELEQGRGVIVASPHLGAWECVGLYCSLIGSMTSLYRAPKLMSLDHRARRGRERFGAHLVPVDASGVRALLAALKKHHIVGILPDQDAGHHNGLFAPFFGTPAATMTLLSRLAHKTNSAVFIAYAQRLPHGAGFRIVCRRASPVVGASTLETAVTALNREVEAAIRDIPEQYLWSYKRFKTQPANVNRP